MTGFAAARFPLVVCGFIVACGSALLLGCGGQPAPPVLRQEPPKAEPEAPIKLTTTEFETECLKDADAAEKKYRRKTVELSGVVNFITYDLQMKVALVNLQPAEKSRVTGVMLIMSDASALGVIGNGQKVTVRGTVVSTISPGLEKCELLEKGPETLVRVGTVELAKEYTAGPGTAQTKYAERTFVLTGKVLGIKTKYETQEFIEFEGDGTTSIQCANPITVQSWKDRVQPGQTVSVSCRMFPSASQDKLFLMTDTVPVPVDRK